MNPLDTPPRGVPYRELRATAALEDNWNGYGAPAPNAAARATAARVLDRAHALGVAVERVVPDAEGGIDVYWIVGRRVTSIECFNDGAVVALVSDRTRDGSCVAWELDATDAAIDAALERIRAFLEAP